MSNFSGRDTFSDFFPPVFDTATQKYEVIVTNRFVVVNKDYAISHKFGAVFTAEGYDETNKPGYGVSLESDGASAAGLGVRQLFPDDKELIGSAVEVGVRMAGTAKVAAGTAFKRGDYVTADPVSGRAILWTDASPIPKLGQAKEDAAVGSLVWIRFNGM